MPYIFRINQIITTSNTGSQKQVSPLSFNYNDTPVGQASSLAENKRPNYSRFKERQTKECHHLCSQTFLKCYANNWLIG
jgi:hypothetical protein